MTKYQVVYCEGWYSHVDYETTDYDQACEVMREYESEMCFTGGSEGYYVLKTINDSEDNEPSMKELIRDMLD